MVWFLLVTPFNIHANSTFAILIFCLPENLVPASLSLECNTQPIVNETRVHTVYFTYCNRRKMSLAGSSNGTNYTHLIDLTVSFGA